VQRTYIFVGASRCVFGNDDSPGHDRGAEVMDKVQTGFIVTTLTSAMVLIASIVWLAALP
jgi:hypothetical protein